MSRPLVLVRGFLMPDYKIDDSDILAYEKRIALEEKKMHTDYKGVDISLTSKDALGLLQVQSAFNFGQSYTMFRWQNGTVQRIKKSEFVELAEFFASERNKLFIG